MDKYFGEKIKDLLFNIFMAVTVSMPFLALLLCFFMPMFE